MLGADELRTGAPVAWAGLAFFAVLAPFAVRDARRFWRGPHKVWDGKPSAWDPGVAYWHGFTRNIPLIAAFDVLVFTPACLGTAIASSSSDPKFLVLAAFATFWFFVLIPLMGGVYFVNRPKWCVPPHRRDEPGAIAEFFENRRARREKAASG